MGYSEKRLLRKIQDQLDGVEWGADTLDNIAELLRSHGYIVREPDEVDIDNAQRVKDFYRAVELCGGFTELSHKLGLELSTVHGWHRRRRVPSWRAEKIAAIIKEYNA